MPQVPLIPREVLFGNPGRAAPRISPDGDRLAYLAPSPQGVLNIWVRTLGRQDDTQVTDDRQRGIRSYTWTHDGRHLLYVQDREGDENWHVHLVHAAERSTRDLTPFDGVRAQGVMLDRHHPGQMLVGLNRSDPSIFDVYRVDLDSGEMTLDTKNPGDVVSWVTDANFQIRGAVAKSTEDGSTSCGCARAPGTAGRSSPTGPSRTMAARWPSPATAGRSSPRPRRTVIPRAWCCSTRKRDGYSSNWPTTRAATWAACCSIPSAGWSRLWASTTSATSGHCSIRASPTISP
ncbi:MAG: hypothetical protein Q9Q13_12940 [Acidobacteriota bacterium]|nr:hypothetical protein [Acidobacteriota bacterium]